MPNKKWYAIAAAGTDTTDIMIYEDVGMWGVTAKDFIAEFKAITSPNINVRINTMGGDVFDGIAIYTAMKESKANVTACVDGIAASIGSIIAMGGKKIVMAPNSFMMVHMPWSYCQGNAEAMRREADILDKLSAQMVAIYAGRTGMTPEECQRCMAQETWMNADEAKASGYTDEISLDGSEDAVAKAAVRAFAGLGKHFSKMPEALKARVGKAIQQDAAEVAAGKAALVRVRQQIDIDERAALA